MKAYYVAGIVREDDGSGYSVYLPDVPAVTTGGDSVEEAITNATEALALALRSMASLNQHIPEPSDLATVRAKVREERQGDNLPFPEDTLFQYIVAPVLDMVMRRINITVPAIVLDEIDTKAKAFGVNRSTFLVAAAKAYNS